MRSLMKNELFESARLKITLQYLIIIMIVSVIFSLAFYQVSTREIQRLIIRSTMNLPADAPGLGPRFLERGRNLPHLVELEELRQRTLTALLLVNGVILMIAGGAGYYLAGRTLQPIKKMVDEQNEFISNASHELRTPLATLRAELESNLLEKKLSEKKTRQILNSNLEEVATLQHLTDRLLKFSQTQNFTAPTSFKKVSLSKIVTAAVKRVAVLAKQKQIKFVTDVPQLSVMAHTPSLIEALVTILDNAIKYSPAQSQIEIEAVQDKHQVILTISDQGKGISPQDLPHIFDRFYRADKSRSQQDGFGLGLAIAQKIIRQHRGTINAQSRVGKGTTITISLPS